MKRIRTELNNVTVPRGIFIIGSQRVVVQVRASKFELEVIDPKQFEDIYGAMSRYTDGKKYDEVI